MRRPLALAALPLVALIACSQDTGGDDLCYCPDAGAFDLGDPREDRPTLDLGVVDGGFDASAPDDRPDAPVGTEPAPIVDAPADRGELDAGADAPDVAAMDAGAEEAGVDAVAVGDVVDVVDAGPTDGGTDATATPELPAVDVADAGPTDTGVDASVDRPDVADIVDVPRDTGPVDGGPVVYDLDTVRSGVTYVVMHRRLDTASSGVNCTAAPTTTSCSVAGGTLRFALTQCGTELVGAFALSLPGTRALSLNTSGAGNFVTNPIFTAGRRNAGSPARQSFHIQFTRAIMGSEPGATGIPGLTVDPTLGDIWLLGCQSE